MAEEQKVNLRIDQLPEGNPSEGDWLVYRETASSTTKKYKYVPPAATTQNFEWVPDKTYVLDEVATYGGVWWQSKMAGGNTGNVPGTDPTKWEQVSKSQAGVWWKAGIYAEDKPWVLSEHNGMPEIFVLQSATRPYNSTDISAEEAAGDWLCITQRPKVEIADTLAAEISLNFQHGIERMFVGSDVINANKTVSFANALNALRFELTLEIAALIAITFPVGTIASDALWDSTTREWTPLDLGKYWIEGVNLNGNWLIKISGPFN